MLPRYITAIFLSILLSTYLVNTVYAKFQIPEWILKTDSGKTVSNETKLDACKRIVETVKDKTSVLEKNRDTHIRNYARLEQSLKYVQSKLKAYKVDTSKLESDTKRLGELVIEYKALYDELLSLLKASTQGVCTQDGQGLRVELQYAKDQLIGLVRKRHEIRMIYKDTIRNDLIVSRGELRVIDSGGEVNE